MSDDGAFDIPRDGDPRVAVPLWGIGAAMFAWGLLRGRLFLMTVGAAAFFADRDAEPVRRVREALEELRGISR